MKPCIAMVISLYAIVLTSLAQADAGWTDYVTVSELIPTGRLYYEVELKGSKNVSGCREQDWYYLNYGAQGTDKMFDLFVDSMQSGLHLRVYVSGLCNLNGYAEITAVGASPK
jgi:hypothetical protein